MRRTAIKRKRARYPSPAQERERREWSEGFERCWVCRRLWVFVPLQTHEIASRAQAPGKWADRRNYFRTCDNCHSEVLSWLPEAAQLAFKKMHNQFAYDRSFINAIRGEADTAITEAEVRNWERFIKAIRG